MAFLTDLLFSSIGSHQANQQYDKIANDYTGAENKSVNAFAPYVRLGQTGVNRLQDMSTPGFAFNPTDPSYAFTKSEGLTGINRQFAATGALDSGGRDRAAIRYASGLADQTYGNEFARNAGLAGMGLTAAGDTSNAYFQGAGGRAGAYSAKAGNNAGYWGGLGASWNDAGNAFASKFGFGG